MGNIRKGRLDLVLATVLAGAFFAQLSCAPKNLSAPPPGWRAISELDPREQQAVFDAARQFAGIVEITDVVYPRIASSHTHVVDVTGVDDEGFEVVVGVDPRNLEVVKMVRLCPRSESEAITPDISSENAAEAASAFIESHGVVIPTGYVSQGQNLVEQGPWKRWQSVWRHVEENVTVLPDFVVIEVNATESANVVTFSKVHHEITVSLEPDLTVLEAIKAATVQMPELARLDPAEVQLAVVYPNNFFEKHVWEWSDQQALCWILEFGTGQGHAVDVWVDAQDGRIRGGEVCHLPSPDVYGIDDPNHIEPNHMQSHLDNIWSPYLDMMKFDVSSLNWTGTLDGISEATITSSIGGGRYFIFEGHGSATTTAEEIHIAYQGSDDEKELTPDEIPVNKLKIAYLGACLSGHDGSGNDFKDEFIKKGADVFIGFDAIMCPWTYEERLLYHLSRGHYLANAHSLAMSETAPDYRVVVTYGPTCINAIRLAPLLTSVERSPSGDVAPGSELKVYVHVENGDDVDREGATNVTAKLVLPEGFAVLSGANPQNIGTVSWNNAKTAGWVLKAPDEPGEYTLDVEISSDNLGVQVDDPDDPYHKFEVVVM